MGVGVGAGQGTDDAEMIRSIERRIAKASRRVVFASQKKSGLEE
jgi:hypothetical protein